MSFIGELFGAGKSPPVAPAPPVPTLADVDPAVLEERRKRGNAGRASTILAGEDNSTTGSSQILLGQGY